MGFLQIILYQQNKKEKKSKNRRKNSQKRQFKIGGMNGR